MPLLLRDEPAPSNLTDTYHWDASQHYPYAGFVATETGTETGPDIVHVIPDGQWAGTYECNGALEPVIVVADFDFHGLSNDTPPTTNPPWPPSFTYDESLALPPIPALGVTPLPEFFRIFIFTEGTATQGYSRDIDFYAGGGLFDPPHCIIALDSYTGPVLRSTDVQWEAELSGPSVPAWDIEWQSLWNPSAADTYIGQFFHTSDDPADWAYQEEPGRRQSKLLFSIDEVDRMIVRILGGAHTHEVDWQVRVGLTPFRHFTDPPPMGNFMCVL